MKQLHTLITRDGRVTVPAEIRRKLGLEPGDRVTFVIDRGEVKLVRKGSVVERTARMLRGPSRGRTAEHLREEAERAIAEEAVERARG